MTDILVLIRSYFGLFFYFQFKSLWTCILVFFLWSNVGSVKRFQTFSSRLLWGASNLDAIGTLNLMQQTAQQLQTTLGKCQSFFFFCFYYQGMLWIKIMLQTVNVLFKSNWCTLCFFISEYFTILYVNFPLVMGFFTYIYIFRNVFISVLVLSVV